MKRCPECRRDYYDDTLMYCLDDGNALLEGPASSSTGDEPPTAIFAVSPAVAGDLARPTDETTLKTAILQPPATAGGSDSVRRFDKRLLLAPLALAVIALGGFFGYRAFSPAISDQINSIAVLPFENRSGNADTDYLSDGLADSLIYRLSQLPNLKVSPTSSVMRYKGKGGDTSQIAKELNVDAVMSGRLVQIGDSLNISVQLTDSRTDKLIWAEQYDRKMADLLATQREIAAAITQKLQLKLSGDEAGLTKKYTDNNEAYQLYLKGRFQFAKRTKGDILKGIEFFEQAVKLDPNFALAYASISEAYNVMPSHTYLSPHEATPKARAAAEKALVLDPTLPEAQVALALVLANYDWNWTEAEHAYKRALELGPQVSVSHFRYGQLLWAVSRFDESLTEMNRALELEPLSLNTSANISLVHLAAGRKGLGLEIARKTNELDPDFVTARLALGIGLNANGQFTDAIKLAEDSLRKDPADQHMLMVAGVAYGRSGDRAGAEAAIRKFAELAKMQYSPPFYVASIFTALGEKDKAFEELEKSLMARDWWLVRLKSDPLMEELRSDARFRDLLKRMNLPE